MCTAAAGQWGCQKKQLSMAHLKDPLWDEVEGCSALCGISASPPAPEQAVHPETLPGAPSVRVKCS